MTHEHVALERLGYLECNAYEDQYRCTAQGDLDLWAILRSLKAAGYDGDIAIEFEGLEDAKYASAVGMQNARRIWNEV